MTDPIIEKMVESCNMWFGFVWRRLLEVMMLIRRVDQMEDSPVIRGRRTLRITINWIIKKNLDFNDLSLDMVLWWNVMTLFDPVSKPHLEGKGFYCMGLWYICTISSRASK